MRPRWLSKRALLLHLALLIWFPGCVIARWWPADAAAASAVSTHGAAGAAPTSPGRASTPRPSARAQRRARVEEELAVYNRQLAQLAAQGPDARRRRR